MSKETKPPSLLGRMLGPYWFYAYRKTGPEVLVVMLRDAEKVAAEYAKQEICSMLKWLLTPNDDYKISSGEGCFYFNGVEKSFPEMYELFQKYNQ